MVEGSECGVHQSIWKVSIDEVCASSRITTVDDTERLVDSSSEKSMIMEQILHSLRDAENHLKVFKAITVLLPYLGSDQLDQLMWFWKPHFLRLNVAVRRRSTPLGFMCPSIPSPNVRNLKDSLNPYRHLNVTQGSTLAWVDLSPLEYGCQRPGPEKIAEARIVGDTPRSETSARQLQFLASIIAHSRAGWHPTPPFTRYHCPAWGRR